MQAKTTTTTFSQNGLWPISFSFRPQVIQISVSRAVGRQFNGIQHCFGWTDGTRKMCDYAFFNPNRPSTARSCKVTDKLVQLWGEDANGNSAVVLEAVLDTMYNENGQAVFNVLKSDINYQVSICGMG